MSEVLPKAAAERPKMAFPVPIGHWLKGDAYGFADLLLREAQTDQKPVGEPRGSAGPATSIPGRRSCRDAPALGAHRVLALAPDLRVEPAYDLIALGSGRGAGRRTPTPPGRPSPGQSVIGRTRGPARWARFTGPNSPSATAPRVKIRVKLRLGEVCVAQNRHG